MVLAGWRGFKFSLDTLGYDACASKRSHALWSGNPQLQSFLAELAIELGSAQKWLGNSWARQGAKLYGAGDS